MAQSEGAVKAEEEGRRDMPGELPGMGAKMGRAQLRALELADAAAELDARKAKVKECQESLLDQMRAEGVLSIKVRDEAGILHQFSVEELVKIKHKIFD